MLVGSTILVILLATVLFDHFRRLRKYKWLSQFGGPSPTLPLLGNALQLAGHSSRVPQIFRSNFKRFGSTWRWWIMENPTLVTCDPKLIKLLLQTNDHIEKHFVYQYSAKVLLGNSLTTSDANQWRLDRKLWNPIFNFEFFASGFNVCVDKWIGLESDLGTNGSKPLDCLHYFRKYFVVATMKSINTDPTLTTEDVLRDWEEGSKIARDILDTRISKPWTRNEIYWKLSGYKKKLETVHKLHGGVFMKLMESFLKVDSLDSPSTLENHENIINSRPKSTKTVKDLFRDMSKSVAWKYDHTVNTIGGASDSSAITATMTLFFLALNPIAQKKVQQEVDLIFEENKDKSLRIGDMSKMKYLRMCIKEAMRLHSPIPVIGRTTTEEIILEDGRAIPKGTPILAVLYELNLNPEHFPNPHKFDPERFRDSNLSCIKPYTYIPFSAGPRNCIGQKFAESTLTVTLAQVLRNFNVTTEQTAEDIKILYSLVGTPYPNVQLIFDRR